MSIDIGFTGSQTGTTWRQQEALRRLFMELAEGSLEDPTLHHGDCIGADDDAAGLAYALGFNLEAYPQNTNLSKRANTHRRYKATKVHTAKEPLKRNRIIVHAADAMVCCPQGPEERRSGTWSTIRYALKYWEEYGDISVYVVWPDGRIDTYPAQKEDDEQDSPSTS